MGSNSFRTKKNFCQNQLFIKLRQKFQKKDGQPREWYIESIGIKDPIINFAMGKLSFLYKKYAINYIKQINKISFCNHILSIFDEKQILDAYFESDKKFLKNNINS